jgi:uncharacterized RDD family membrane protein YckC
MEEKQPLSIADLSPVTPEAPVTLGEPPVKDMEAPAEQVYKATFLRRFGALFLDFLVLLIAYIPFAAVAYLTKQFAIVYLFNIVSLAYFIFFTWKYGATLGKKWLKIKVVSANGKPLSLIQVILREVVGKALSGMVFYLGYLWMLWDKDRQTWHDKIAGTYVVTPLPNNGKTSGFTIALVVAMIAVVPISIIVFAVFAYYLINPLEINKRARDAVRIADLTAVQTHIEATKMKLPRVQNYVEICLNHASVVLRKSQHLIWMGRVG